MYKLTEGDMAILRLVRDSDLSAQVIGRTVELDQLISEGYLEIKGKAINLTTVGETALLASEGTL